MAIIDPLKIHLTNIVRIFGDSEDKCKNFSKDKIKIGVSHAMMHNLEQKKIKINMTIEILDDKSLEDPFHTIYDFFFTVDDLEAHYQFINEKPLFDGIFVSTLLSITYSTIRGILFNQFTQEPLKNLMLPIINIPDLLKN